MVTQKGENTSVVAIHGNFDNAQSGVKEIFEDAGFAKELADAGYQFSSANSINIGRLVPQVVYYVSRRQTPSISGVSFPRWSIMYMRMRSFWKMKRSHPGKPSM